VTNQPGSFARLWIARVVSTLVMCVGAMVLVPAASPAHDSQVSPLSTGCGIAAPDTGQALTAGVLAPESTDSTDDDDDDDGDELPTGSMVLPAPPISAERVAMEFIECVGVAAVRAPAIDSHSLRAPPSSHAF